MSIFKWTSPIRQGGLSPIPNEVYMEIFKHLRPPDNNPWIDPVYRRDFSRVALVCRFFCSVMLPWIYESMGFAGKTNSPFDLNHAPFCRSIIRGCESARTMATYVKRCSFSDWIQDKNDSTPSCYNTEFQTLYSKALAFMPNVEELELKTIHINKYLLKSIMELKNLTSLSLEFCRIGEVKAKDIRKLSTLQLKHLRFIGCSSTFDKVISQSLCLDSVLTLRTNHWPLVERIAEQNCHLPLEGLAIQVIVFDAENMELLPKIFQKTPALEMLRITCTATEKHDVQFDDVLLPALRELCCPLSLLRTLVPGRPISRIEITEWRLTEMNDLHSFFKRSTRKIRSLRVPIHFYKTVPFWEHFPDLESLQLDVTILRPNCLGPLSKYSLNKSLSDISNAWPHNPPIRELHLGFSDTVRSVDLELQNELLSTLISPAFPQLRRITISNFVAWNKVQEDDVWKPSLHLVPLLCVAKQLRSSEDNFVDYDGFFERILSTVEEFW